MFGWRRGAREVPPERAPPFGSWETALEVRGSAIDRVARPGDFFTVFDRPMPSTLIISSAAITCSFFAAITRSRRRRQDDSRRCHGASALRDTPQG